ncbi:transcription initiation protein [Mycobacterium asiaticum]|uniref:Transcription initiation protein n=1 Tax=Mycobacterium asiaticum TaxID=1790 RepID=A0A1A3PEJ6_MYCAS|nr:YciI family protein [Mycobacterium asiaticum]OBK31714.1 transcription initiation protein [Mycobacterium asiaticum]
MQYLALLISEERNLTPDERGATKAAFQGFHAKAASAIRAGDALTPTSTGMVITGGPDAPVVTDGPFAEAAEVACGYYVLEAENLDDALELARDIPAAAFGAVEVWPMFGTFECRRPSGTHWLALLLEPPSNAVPPGTPEWQAMAAPHGEFAAAAGERVIGGAALHEPSTATTVRVRDSGVLITDGPYVEGAEVANGFYVLTGNRDEAAKVAAMIPASKVELRQLAGASGL